MREGPSGQCAAGSECSSMMGGPFFDAGDGGHCLSGRATAHDPRYPAASLRPTDAGATGSTPRNRSGATQEGTVRAQNLGDGQPSRKCRPSRSAHASSNCRQHCRRSAGANSPAEPRNRATKPVSSPIRDCNARLTGYAAPYLGYTPCLDCVNPRDDSPAGPVRRTRRGRHWPIAADPGPSCSPGTCDAFR